MTLIRQIARHAPVDLARYLPFAVDGQTVGWVKPGFAQHLARFPAVFDIGVRAVVLSQHLADFERRSHAVADVLAILRADGLIPGWRDEAYPVGQGFHLPPLLQMERAATPLFGTLTYGVNLNGFTGRGGDMRIWIGKRAAHKPIAPGALDLVVGGGQPMGISLWDNLMKECREEAAIPAAIAAGARPVGVTAFMIETEHGLRHDLQFNYDLALPADFTPDNMDGEVAEFRHLPVAEIRRLLEETDDFMYDVALVLIDFLIRHGFIGPEHPDYLPLVAGLRRPIGFAKSSGAVA